MAWKVGVTRFKHFKFGEGVLKEIKASSLVIDFENYGKKQISRDFLNNGSLTELVVETSSKPKIKANDSHVKQYDSASIVIGGKNVIESFSRQEHSIFNESYIIIGSELQNTSIQAAYDLVVIGDVDAYEISVNGNLTVIGNLSAEKVSCLKNLICQGSAEVEDLYVGGNVVCDSIKAVKFVCDSNAVVTTTIDIDESSRTEKTMVACEGIMGAGEFSALNAIANEYFDFHGDISGKIVELETDTTFSEIQQPVSKEEHYNDCNTDKIDFGDVLTIIEERLEKELENISQWDEDVIIEFLRTLKEKKITMFANAQRLFESLVSISYREEITDFGDYLLITYAKKALPESIYGYESIEHVYSQLLPQAINDLEDMKFFPESVRKIANSLMIVELCADDLHISVKDAFEKIFGSIGLKYSTVEKATKSKVLADLDRLAGTGNNAEAHRTLVRHGYTNSHSDEYQQIWKNYWWKIRY